MAAPPPIPQAPTAPLTPLAVSIVMPSLNQGEYIEAALRSILIDQIPVLEIIVMDGQSTDATVQHLKRISSEFPGRIRWWSEPDSGPAEALNKAWAYARGDVVGWLNADDLYTPGAIERACAAFQANPDCVMVYGEAMHLVDAAGNQRRYPTLPPETPLSAFSEGCFICQPTVFLRRKSLSADGLLDPALKTAFDFELWLRLFRAYPHRIGLIEEIQAYSRMHEETITARSRRQVAMESMQVLARNGIAPGPGWVLTHMDEVCKTHPSPATAAGLPAYADAMLRESAAFLDEATFASLRQRILADRRIQLGRSKCYVDVTPDGWALDVTLLRIHPIVGACRVTLTCDAAWPVFEPFHIRVERGQAILAEVEIAKAGPFQIELLVIEDAGEPHDCVLRASRHFVPSLVNPESQDARRLAFLVTDIEVGAA